MALVAASAVEVVQELEGHQGRRGVLQATTAKLGLAEAGVVEAEVAVEEAGVVGRGAAVVEAVQALGAEVVVWVVEEAVPPQHLCCTGSCNYMVAQEGMNHPSGPPLQKPLQARPEDSSGQRPFLSCHCNPGLLHPVQSMSERPCHQPEQRGSIG